MQKCDRSKSGTLAGEEIKHFYDLLTQRDEIDVIYGEYAKTTGFMSAQNLVDFLLKEQREKATLADAHRIIETYEPDENGQYNPAQWMAFRSSQDRSSAGFLPVKISELYPVNGLTAYGYQG